MSRNRILVLDQEPRIRVEPYVRKYRHLAFTYFGVDLTQQELTRATRQLLDDELTDYDAVIISSLKTSHGPTIYRLAQRFVARGKPVVALVFTKIADSKVRAEFVRCGVTRFAILSSGLQQELEKLMQERLLSSPASSGG